MLRVSTEASIAAVAAEITEAVRRHLLSNAASGMPAAVDELKALRLPPLPVELVVADGAKNTMLSYSQAIYNASVAEHVAARIDVVPRFAQRGCADLSNLTTALMDTNPSFRPSFDYVAMGGTFDHLHAGHKMLLLSSLAVTRRRLRIGMAASQLLVRKKNAHVLESFEERVAEVRRFVTLLRPDLEYEIEEITDMPGGTDKIPGVQALVVSPESLPAVAAINTMRAANALPPMEGVLIAFVGGDDDASRVSSTKLRVIAASGEPSKE